MRVCERERESVCVCVCVCLLDTLNLLSFVAQSVIFFTCTVLFVSVCVMFWFGCLLAWLFDFTFLEVFVLAVEVGFSIPVNIYY